LIFLFRIEKPGLKQYFSGAKVIILLSVFFTSQAGKKWRIKNGLAHE